MSEKNEVKAGTNALTLVLSLNIISFILANMEAFASHTNNRPMHLIFQMFLHIGLSQLIYVIPLIFWAQYKQNWGFLKGTIVAAIFTILINGSCGFLSFK